MGPPAMPQPSAGGGYQFGQPPTPSLMPQPRQRPGFQPRPSFQQQGYQTSYGQQQPQPGYQFGNQGGYPQMVPYGGGPGTGGPGGYLQPQRMGGMRFRRQGGIAVQSPGGFGGYQFQPQQQYPQQQYPQFQPRMAY